MGGILNFPQFKSFSLNQNTFCKILAFTTRIHNLAAFLKRGQRHGFAHFGKTKFKMEIPLFVFCTICSEGWLSNIGSHVSEYFTETQCFWDFCQCRQ